MRRLVSVAPQVAAVALRFGNRRTQSSTPTTSASWEADQNPFLADLDGLHESSGLSSAPVPASVPPAASDDSYFNPFLADLEEAAPVVPVRAPAPPVLRDTVPVSPPPSSRRPFSVRSSAPPAAPPATPPPHTPPQSPESRPSFVRPPENAPSVAAPSMHAVSEDEDVSDDFVIVAPPRPKRQPDAASVPRPVEERATTESDDANSSDAWSLANSSEHAASLAPAAASGALPESALAARLRGARGFDAVAQATFNALCDAAGRDAPTPATNASEDAATPGGRSELAQSVLRALRQFRVRDDWTSALGLVSGALAADVFAPTDSRVWTACFVDTSGMAASRGSWQGALAVARLAQEAGVADQLQYKTAVAAIVACAKPRGAMTSLGGGSQWKVGMSKLGEVLDRWPNRPPPQRALAALASGAARGNAWEVSLLLLDALREEVAATKNATVVVGASAEPKPDAASSSTPSALQRGYRIEDAYESVARACADAGRWPLASGVLVDLMERTDGLPPTPRGLLTLLRSPDSNVWARAARVACAVPKPVIAPAAPTQQSPMDESAAVRRALVASVAARGEWEACRAHIERLGTRVHPSEVASAMAAATAAGRWDAAAALFQHAISARVPEFHSPAAHGVFVNGVTQCFLELFSACRTAAVATGSLQPPPPSLVIGGRTHRDQLGNGHATNSGRRVVDALVDNAAAAFGPHCWRPETLPSFLETLNFCGRAASTLAVAEQCDQQEWRRVRARWRHGEVSADGRRHPAHGVLMLPLAGHRAVVHACCLSGKWRRAMATLDAMLARVGLGLEASTAEEEEPTDARRLTASASHSEADPFVDSVRWARQRRFDASVAAGPDEGESREEGLQRSLFHAESSWTWHVAERLGSGSGSDDGGVACSMRGFGGVTHFPTAAAASVGPWAGDPRDYWDSWADEVKVTAMPMVSAACEAVGHTRDGWRFKNCP